MIHNTKTGIYQVLFVSAGLLLGGSLLSCSGNKKTEKETVSTTVDTTNSVLGRQGDTTGSNPTMDQQAPPDSAQASGPTVPAGVNVRVKK